jgi:small conductance mechanosensitive channel
MENLLHLYAGRLNVWIVDNLPNIVIALVLAIVVWIGAGWCKRAITRTAARLKWDEIIWDYLGTALRYVVIAVGFTTALRQAGVPVDTMLATFGISGVIIGLGARASIANYFAGMMLLSARPFKQGDLIEFGPPPQIGRVTEVKMTYTGLVTLDNVRLIVPNSVMWRNKIVNFSSYQIRAIRIPLSMPYDVDVDWVRDLVLDVCKGHDSVLDDPVPTFSVSDVSADKIKCLVVAWSRVETMNVFGEVISKMRKEFETATLAVVVPAQDIDLRREE